MGGQMSWLGVKIAGQNWLVEMADISEVLSLPRLAMVPLAQPWFRGVAMVSRRGQCAGQFIRRGRYGLLFANR